MGITLRRHHLFEIIDQKWCPRTIRGAATDYIQFEIKTGKLDIAMASLLRRALKRSKTRSVVDLCSGSGGPWMQILNIFKEKKFDVTVCLTDKYPNGSAFRHVCSEFPGTINFYDNPVDAGHVPDTLTGFRTLFSSLHHFRPDEVCDILQDAVNSRQGIGIFETTDRTLSALFIQTIASLVIPFCIPFVKPFRWSRLFWTYLVPLLPVVLFYDSLISCLRTYSVHELHRFTEKIDADGYIWEIGHLPVYRLHTPITYLFGYPSPQQRGQNPGHDGIRA